MGRPTKLTDDAQQRIVDAIKLGATYELAAAAGGVDYSTFNNWMNRARKELERQLQPRTRPRQREARFVQFFHAVKSAEGAAAINALRNIQAAAGEDWRAAAWLLERRHGYVRQTDVTSGGEKIINITVDGVIPDDDDGD